MYNCLVVYTDLEGNKQRYYTVASNQPDLEEDFEKEIKGKYKEVLEWNIGD